MMVAYHAVYDVWLLAPAAGPDPFTGAWGAVPEATAALFLGLAGLSVWLADARLRARGVRPGRRLGRLARHASVVLGAGVLVVVVTTILFGDEGVRFGILQTIGVSIVIAGLVARLGVWNVLIGGVVLVAPAALAIDSWGGSPWLIPLGAGPQGFASVDYWPLVPWLGPVLVGLGVGAALYPSGERCAALGRLASLDPRMSALSAPGRHSLAVYLAHQAAVIPAMWALLVLAGVDVSWP